MALGCNETDQFKIISFHCNFPQLLFDFKSLRLLHLKSFRFKNPCSKCFSWFCRDWIYWAGSNFEILKSRFSFNLLFIFYFICDFIYEFLNQTIPICFFALPCRSPDSNRCMWLSRISKWNREFWNFRFGSKVSVPS